MKWSLITFLLLITLVFVFSSCSEKKKKEGIRVYEWCDKKSFRFPVCKKLFPEE